MEKVGKGLINPSRLNFCATSVFVLLVLLQGFDEILGQSDMVKATESAKWIWGHESGSPNSSFQQQGRVRRDATELEEDEDEPDCTQLPPRPPKSNSANAPISLMDLLNNGSYHMMEDGPVDDAILILGNTGSGKTTITQIIAGDLSRLHAVKTRGRRLVIIDDDNRIGAPSTISKTLVPELVMADAGVAFYDCPGFDDTRGPEKDIAANFFINQVIRGVSRVKLLFLVIHNSVRLGQDRLDLDLLVSHATKFLKRGRNYRDSIALVVTKVNSYDDAGKFVKSKAIMNEIVEFLTMYLDDLRSQLKSEDSGISDVHRKIEFVETLLEQNEEGRYGRITFSRSPLECGPLSNSKVVLDTRKRLIQIYSDELEYTPVNPSDFGYTLKDKTKLEILNFVENLNEDVGNGIGSTMADFKRWVDGGNTSTELIGRIKNIKNSISALDRAGATWYNMQNSTNPMDLVDVLKSNLASLGYSIPPNFQGFLKQQNNYFNFFDEVNAAMVNRQLGDWGRPVEDLKLELVKEEAKLKLELRNQVVSLNKNLTAEISVLIGSFMNWFNSTYLQTNDLAMRLKEIKRATERFDNVLSHLNVLGERSNPEDFARVIKPTLEGMGFEFPGGFQVTIGKLQAYLEYDDEVNPPGVHRAVREWATPISREAAVLNELGDKTEMALDLHLKNVKVVGLQDELTETRGQLAFQERELSANRIVNEEQSTEIIRLGKEVAKSLEENNGLEMKVKGLRGEMEEARSQLAFLERELSAKSIINEEQSTEIIRLGKEVAKNLEENNELEMKVKGLQGQLEAQQRTTDTLNEHLERKANESRRLEGEHRNLAQVKLARMQGLKAGVKSKFELLKQEKATNSEIIRRQTEINRRCESSLDGMRKEAKSNTATIEKKNIEIWECTKRLDLGESKLVTCEAKLLNDTNRISSLHLAAIRQDEQSIKTMVESGANVNAKNNNSETPIILAANGDDVTISLRIIEYLERHGANLFAVDGDGRTFLHVLFSKSNALTSEAFHTLVEYLDLRNAANLFNVQDKVRGRTPLMLAARSTQINESTMKFLKSNGVSVTLQDKEDKSVVSYLAEGSQNRKLWSGLINNDGTIRHAKLDGAIAVMDEVAVKQLVFLGADVNAANSNLVIPLHQAANVTNKAFAIRIIKFLIQNGANPSAKDGNGCTFLHKLVEGGTMLTPVQFHDISEFLIQRSVSLLFNAPDNIWRTFVVTQIYTWVGTKNTPFMLAVKNIEIQNSTLALLKSNGVNFNAVNGGENSVLWYAIEGRRSTRMLSALVAFGANPKQLCIYERSFLHWAALLGNLEQLNFFLNVGLDINAVSNYGWTPLELACAFGFENLLEIGRFLIAKGANAESKRRALIIVKSYGHLPDKDKLVQLLGGS